MKMFHRPNCLHVSLRIEFCRNIQESSIHFRIVNGQKFTSIQKRQNMLLRILKYISLKTELTPEFKDNTNKSSGRLSTKCSREEGDSKSAAVAIPTDSYSGEGRRTPGIGNRATPVLPSVHEKVIQDVKRRGKEKQSKNDSGEQYSHSSATIIPTVSAASSQDGKTPGIGNQATPVQPTVHKHLIQDIKRRRKDGQSKKDSGEQYSHSSATKIQRVSFSSQDGKTPGIGNQVTPVQPSAHKKVIQDIKLRGIERQYKKESGEEYSNSSTTDISTVSSSGQDGKYPRIANQATPVQLALHKRVFKVSKREGTDRQSKKKSGEQQFTSPATAFPIVSSFGQDGRSAVIAFHATTTQPIVHRIDFRDSKREGVDRQSIMAKER